MSQGVARLWFTVDFSLCRSVWHGVNFTEEAQTSPPWPVDAWKRAGLLTPKPGRAFKSQAGQQSRSPKAKVSGLFPEWQVRSLGPGKPPGDRFHMDSPLSCPVKGAGWESPFSFAGEETEAQGGRRPGTPEGSEAGQEPGS